MISSDAKVTVAERQRAREGLAGVHHMHIELLNLAVQIERHLEFVRQKKNITHKCKMACENSRKRTLNFFYVHNNDVQLPS